MGMTNHDPLTADEIEVIDNRDMALLVTATFDGKVKINCQLAPDKAVDLLRRIADNIEGNAPDGTLIAGERQ